jgi:hypothetical protein
MFSASGRFRWTRPVNPAATNRTRAPKSIGLRPATDHTRLR